MGSREFRLGHADRTTQVAANGGLVQRYVVAVGILPVEFATMLRRGTATDFALYEAEKW